MKRLAILCALFASFAILSCGQASKTASATPATPMISLQVNGQELTFTHGAGAQGEVAATADASSPAVLRIAGAMGPKGEVLASDIVLEIRGYDPSKTDYADEEISGSYRLVSGDFVNEYAFPAKGFKATIRANGDRLEGSFSGLLPEGSTPVGGSFVARAST